MRSIERRFNKFQERNPALSSYSNFAKAVCGQHFSTDKISRWFTKLVEKGDYDKRDRKRLIAQLSELSNTSEEHKK